MSYRLRDAYLSLLHKNQPCVFGRIAAQMNRMDIFFLSEPDLCRADEDLQELLRLERLLWKQRCLRNERPEHGFLLIAASPRLALASPNRDLYTFSKILREIYGADIEPDLRGNDIAWEELYLEQPGARCVRFRFSLDFFAAQGDRRWWHDHRIPGGIGYTANSVGHMSRVREWYEKKGSQTEWVIKVAMETVDEAADTSWGRAISLRELKNGHPYSGSKCPFQSLDKLKPRLQGRDWSAYRGNLSTDHSLREELFEEDPDPPRDLPEWNMDLTYLYDATKEGISKFMGQEISCEDVLIKIGEPTERRILASEGHEGSKYVASKLRELESQWGWSSVDSKWE